MNAPLVSRRSNYTDLHVKLLQSVGQTLTGEQMRFLALHAAAQPPNVWQWLWGSTLLRASNERGDTAHIPAAQFDQLVRLKFVRRSGMAGAVITTAGRSVVA